MFSIKLRWCEFRMGDRVKVSIWSKSFTCDISPKVLKKVLSSIELKNFSSTHNSSQKLYSTKHGNFSEHMER